MGQAAKPPVTHAQYVALERASAAKHELVNGEIVAMSGGSPAHSLIAANVTRLLGNLLVSDPCAVFNSDLRVVVKATGLTTYPDVTVVCGPRELHPEDDHAITNPRVILEVLSPTTEAYDRGAKFAHYQSVPSLEEYVLVASVGRRIEHYRRQPTGQWLLTTHVADDASVELPALGGSVRLGDVYAKVE